MKKYFIFLVSILFAMSNTVSAVDNLAPLLHANEKGDIPNANVSFYWEYTVQSGKSVTYQIIRLQGNTNRPVNNPTECTSGNSWITTVNCFSTINANSVGPLPENLFSAGNTSVFVRAKISSDNNGASFEYSSFSNRLVMSGGIPENSYPPPATSNVITDCAEITSSGMYTLGSNVVGIINNCISIHDTSDVTIDCLNKSVTSENPLFVKNSNNFTLKNCTFVSTHGASAYLEKVVGGKVTNNIFRPSGNYPSPVSVKDSRDLLIESNNFVTAFEQNYTSYSDIRNNTFTARYPIVYAAMIVSNFGNNNKISNNNINGSALGTFADQKGSDDGIVLQDEQSDTIENNVIKNNWDCGIETVGVISSSNFKLNTITNNGYCGIGAWYWNSWIGNVVENNVIDTASRAFKFYRDGGLRIKNTNTSGHSTVIESKSYFKDNIFKDNIFRNQTRDSGLFLMENSRFETAFTHLRSGATTEFERAFDMNDVIATNNHFKNNDFGTFGLTPSFNPGSMVVDDGGNVCSLTKVNPDNEKGGALDLSQYPLNCSQTIVTVPSLIQVNIGTAIPWTSGSTHTITWQARAIPADAKIVLSYFDANLQSSASNPTKIVELAPTATSYDWTVPVLLITGHSYSLRVSAITNAGVVADAEQSSQLRTERTFIIPTPPALPVIPTKTSQLFTAGPCPSMPDRLLSNRPDNITNLTATPSNKKVKLEWCSASRSQSYDLYRFRKENDPLPGDARWYGLSKTLTSYTDTTVLNNTQYYYKIFPIGKNRTTDNGSSNLAGPVTPLVSLSKRNLENQLAGLIKALEGMRR